MLAKLIDQPAPPPLPELLEGHDSNYRLNRQRCLCRDTVRQSGAGAAKLMVSMPLLSHLRLLQGHILLSTVPKNSLVQQDQSVNSRNWACGCHVWKEASHKGKGRKGWGIFLPAPRGRRRNLFTWKWISQRGVSPCIYSWHTVFWIVAPILFRRCHF